MNFSLTVGAIADSSGRLRPLPAVKEAANLGRGRRLIAIHRPSAGAEKANWIVADETTAPTRLMWMSEDADPGQLAEICTIDSALGETAALGATLVIAGDGGLRYLHWRGDGYDDLGSELPEMTVEFRLVRELMPVASQRITIDLGNASTAAAIARGIPTDATQQPRFRLGAGETSAVARGEMTDAVMGALLSAAADSITARGCFWQPFMVRCALRLFDGSVTAHGPTVAMWPSATVPLLPVSNLSVDSSAQTLEATTSFERLARCRLEMRLLGADPAKIALWGDYIESLDVAVTEPVWTFDQGAPVVGVAPMSEQLFAGSGQRPGAGGAPATGSADDEAFLGHWGLPGAASMEQRAKKSELAASAWILQPRSEAEFADDLCSRSAFHLFESVKADVLVELARSREWTALRGADEATASLIAVEPLLDDGLRCRDRWDAAGLTAYNGRLIIAPRRRLLAAPPALKAMACHCDPRSAAEPDRRMVSVAVDYLIEGARAGSVRSSRTPGVNSASAPDLSPDSVGDLADSFPRWLYVADPDATELRLYSGEWGSDSARPLTVTLALRRHPTMNGAYWYGGRGARTAVAIVEPSAAVQPSAGSSAVGCGAMLLTSAFRCPMSLSSPGAALTLPGRRIMAIRAALRAMSEGQFGAYPLYAFTDRGVSVLAPDSSGAGSWSSQHLLTPRGLASPRGLTAMEEGVVYVSHGGVMLLRGSSIKRIDEPIDQRRLYEPPAEWLPRIGLIEREARLMGAIAEDAIAPLDYAESLCLAYDPRQRLLLLYREKGSMMARVYSPDSGAWALLRQGAPWLGAITEAEGAVAPLISADSSGRLLRLGAGSQPMMLLSSPMTLDDGRPWRPGLIELAMLPSTSTVTSLTLYGSNDRRNWQAVASARGSRLAPLVAGTPRRHYILVATARND